LKEHARDEGDSVVSLAHELSVAGAQLESAPLSKPHFPAGCSASLGVSVVIFHFLDRIFFWNMAQLLVLLPAGSGV
jgi:hypothetical protein